MNFSEKSSKKCFISWKNTKILSFGQNCQPFEQSTMFRRLHEFFIKKLQKVPHFVIKHENSSILQKRSTFPANHHVSAFWRTFEQKVLDFVQKRRKIIDLAKTLNFSNKSPRFGVLTNFWAKSCKKGASFREKTRKMIELTKTLNFSNKLRCFGVCMNFSEKSSKKCFISWKKHEKSFIWPKLSTFRTRYHVSAFARMFQQKVAKSASFCDKTRKVIDLAKTLNFSNKLPCFGVFMKFSAKSCKKCPISWKNTKIIDLAKTLNFSNILPCFGACINFSAKTCKNCLISWKNTKNHRFRQHSQLFEQTTTFRRFEELFTKILRKVPHFARKHENSSIWQELGTIQANHHVSGFWRTFGQKVGKRASFREKTREMIELTKTLNFSKKLRCFGVCMNFSEKRSKKCFISWKNTKNLSFGPNCQPFEQSTMFRRLHEFFIKKLQKVPHFVIKHENSSILQKRSTFPANHHVSTFWRTFQQKVAKSAWFREKKTKNHRFGQDSQLFEQITTFRRFHELISKKLQKVLHFPRKHVKSSIWPKLATFWTNHHV